MSGLGLSLLLALTTPPVPSDADTQTRMAPLGEVSGAAEPMKFVFAGASAGSHVSEVGPVESRALGLTCEAAFSMALTMLAGRAREQGANGIVELTSPDAEPSAAPSFACRNMEYGMEVRLTGVAARIGVAGLENAGQSVRLEGAAGPSPAGLRRRNSLGHMVFEMPGQLATGDVEVRFFRETGGHQQFTRRLSDVEAEGRSTESCEGALEAALTSLAAAARADGAQGIAGVRSPDLVTGHQFVCETTRREMTVRLVGTGTAAPL